jgi:hypothetical protein
LTSKIINMAERMKDENDRLLESMFASEPIADDGFSARIVTRVRRRIWLRRLALPVAIVGGALVSFKPLAGLVKILSGFVALVPQDILSAPAAAVPQFSLLLLGAALLATCLVGLRLLDD